MPAYAKLLIAALLCLSTFWICAQETQTDAAAEGTVWSKPLTNPLSMPDTSVPGVPPTSPQAERLKANYRIEQISVDQDGIPATVAGDLGPENPSGSFEADAHAYLVKNAASYGLTNPDVELRFERTDSRGATRVVRFTQYYKALPVWGSRVNVVFGRKNRITDVSANLVPNLNMDVVPAIDSTAAKTAAAGDLRAVVSDCRFDVVSLCIYRTFQRKIHLAWQIDISANRGGVWTYFIDARDGSVVDRQTHLRI